MTKKPKTYSLFWIEDNVHEDWFIAVPSIGSTPIECDLAEELHSFYENLHYKIYAGSIYPECHAKFICHFPTEILENTNVETVDAFGNKKDQGMNYLEASKEAYDELLERLQDNNEYIIKDIFDELDDTLKDKIFDYTDDSKSIPERFYSFATEVFDDQESFESFINLYYGLDEDEFEIIETFLCSLYQHRILKLINAMPNLSYGCIHGQNDFLEKIDGMTMLDDGLDSPDNTRTYIFNGCLYQEGGSVEHKLK